MLTSVNDLVAANERFLEALKFQKRPTQPLSQTIWKIKDLYLRSRYQECIAKATRELRFADENVSIIIDGIKSVTDLSRHIHFIGQHCHFMLDFQVTLGQGTCQQGLPSFSRC